LEVYGQAAMSSYTRGLPIAPNQMRVARCDECADRLGRAEALVTVHGLGRVFGTVAADKLDAALAALDVIGIRGDRTAVLTRTPAATRELVAAVAHIGAAASWSARIILGGDPRASAPRRWSGISSELVQAAGEEYKALIHRRAEVPFPFTPPADGAQGCLLCGIGTLTVKESNAKAAWGEQRQARLGTLGGRSRPEPVKGYVCPTCRASVDEVGGALGMPAVEHAVLRHLGYRLPWGHIEAWPGVVAWAALRPGTAPNSGPWAHLHLAALARGLDRNYNFQRDEKSTR
jgi:uncharacterized protein YlaI